jgi:putative tricarboxylic transport membrane protein
MRRGFFNARLFLQYKHQMEWIGPALANVFSPLDLLVMVAGVAGGILVGALPGLTGTMAIALLVPFTYSLRPDASLVMLGGVYVGAMYGGSISAILINTPGAPAAIATTFDGYPMAQKGQAEEALATSATGSAIGGILGTVVLLLFSPVLAAISLRFGPPEYFWLGILGLTIIASLSAKSLPKGLLGGLFGVLISTIGLSPSTGVARMTFNVSDLLGGVEIIIALIGLFCIPQVFNMVEKIGHGDSGFPSPGRTVIQGHAPRSQTLGQSYPLIGHRRYRRHHSRRRRQRGRVAFLSGSHASGR